MTLQDLGNIGEFVGAVGVVASLIYLALQIRQNSKLLRASTMQDMTSGAAMFVSSIAQDAETAGLLIRGMANYDSLSPEQRTQFAFLLFHNFSQIQHSHYLHSERLLPDQAWESVVAIARFYFAAPGVRTWWRTGGSSLMVRDFAQFLDEEVLRNLEKGSAA